MLEKAKADIASRAGEGNERPLRLKLQNLLILAARKIVKTGEANDTGSSK